MIINGMNIGCLNRPFLVAEGGSSHEGIQEKAIEMALLAVRSGADALTFQEIDETKLFTLLDELPVAPMPRVGWDCLKECRKIAKDAGLAFSVCVTDSDSLEEALSIGIDFIKIVSYDINFHPFLTVCGNAGLPVFMSTGASTFDEVEEALGFLNAGDRVLLYHTDCGYPTKDCEINMMRMIKLKERFGLPVGYCDHTNHGLSCLSAASLGADVIEKHFILSRSSRATDYMVALEEEELLPLFQQIKRIGEIRGSGSDTIEEGDLFRRNNLRRSVALKNDVPAGYILSEKDLTMLRPPTGLSWEERNNIIGKKTLRDMNSRYILKTEDVEQQ